MSRRKEGNGRNAGMGGEFSVKVRVILPREGVTRSRGIRVGQGVV